VLQNKNISGNVIRENWEGLSHLNKKYSDLIYQALRENMQKNRKIILLGEDIVAPYGWAFNVTRDLSQCFPEQVFSTPISEAAITGISGGLALTGFQPVLEIMFGDFVTLCMDQLINHLAKFPYMYQGVKCPVIIRTPMGGGRGYGPTHSQTFDKMFLGIDGIQVIALNCLVNPMMIYSYLFESGAEIPTIIIENKSDYNRRNMSIPNGYKGMVHRVRGYPIIKILPEKSFPNITIVSYGGLVETILECLPVLFQDYEIKVEFLILSQIKPIDYQDILESVSLTKRLYVIEEGSKTSGVGSEIIASICEQIQEKVVVRRIGSLSGPIPANKEMERDFLVNQNNIIKEILVGEAMVSEQSSIN